MPFEEFASRRGKFACPSDSFIERGHVARETAGRSGE
jgi:hypothetical protein